MASFVLMGSGEFEAWAEPVDRWAIEASGVDSDRVLVSPAAAAPEGEKVFDEWAAKGKEHFSRLGMKPEVLGVKTRADAEDADIVKQIAGARYIFFSGGNPGVLSETFADTPAWKAIVDAVAGGMSFGGCSAGIVALGTVAIDTRAWEDHRSPWVPGLQLFTKAYFGAHWDMLDAWEPGTTEKILEAWPPGTVLFALDEETAASGDGERWTVRGKGALSIPGPDGLERVTNGGQAIVDLGLTL